MTATFKELQESPEVSAAQLKSTLEYYAVTGAAISPRIVIDLINRVGLTAIDKAALTASALKGYRDQTRRSGTKSADEYNEVVYYLLNS